MCTCTRFYIARCIFHAATYRTGCLLLFIHRNVLGAILTTHTHRLTLTHDTLVSQLEPSHSGRHAMHDAQWMVFHQSLEFLSVSHICAIYIKLPLRQQDTHATQQNTTIICCISGHRSRSFSHSHLPLFLLWVLFSPHFGWTLSTTDPHEVYYLFVYVSFDACYATIYILIALLTLRSNMIICTYCLLSVSRGALSAVRPTVYMRVTVCLARSTAHCNIQALLYVSSYAAVSRSLARILIACATYTHAFASLRCHPSCWRSLVRLRCTCISCFSRSLSACAVPYQRATRASQSTSQPASIHIPVSVSFRRSCYSHRVCSHCSISSATWSPKRALLCVSIQLKITLYAFFLLFHTIRCVFAIT